MKTRKERHQALLASLTLDRTPLKSTIKPAAQLTTEAPRPVSDNPSFMLRRQSFLRLSLSMHA